MLYAEALQFSDEDQPGALRSDEVFFSNEVPSQNSDELARRLNANRARHLRYLRSRLPSPEDAEDALQDATLKLIRHADMFKKTECPDAWIGVALRNTVIDRYRRAAAQRRLAETLSIEPAASTESEEEDTLTPIACLKAALPSLKNEYAQLLQQVYLGDVSLSDVARHEQLTCNNVAVRLHRARNALRQKMQRQCPICPLEDCWARHRPIAVAASLVAGHLPA
jgi:RNA polymerase sigma-70 factor (ECF subfamily)